MQVNLSWLVLEENEQKLIHMYVRMLHWISDALPLVKAALASLAELPISVSCSNNATPGRQLD